MKGKQLAAGWGQLRERLKRWTRIHVTKAQSRDLFYPMCAFDSLPPASVRVGLIGGHAESGSAFVNGHEVELIFEGKKGDTCWYELRLASAVLPGENVVSLPVAWNVADARIEATSAEGGDRSGWGSQPVVEVNSGHPGVDAAAAFLMRSLTRTHRDDELISLTAFDVEAGGPRLWSWYWTTASSYEALVGLCRRGAVRLDLSPIEAGLRLRQIDDGDAAGSYMVRWDPDRLRQTGIVSWHAPNDSAYIGLHGLLVAERINGDPVYLDQALRLARWITGPGMLNGRLRVGWDGQRRDWVDSWLYVDAAWTPAFLVALARRTGDRSWLAAADAMARDIVERFGTAGPYYHKIWRANGRHTRTVFARGMAWILEGWIPLVEEGYDWLVPRVRALVRALIADQRRDGAWDYLIDERASGACNKGTPALAYHLHRAAAVFPELREDLLASVHSALLWCERHQVQDPDSPAFGGIVAHNSEGAIATVRDIATAFNYGAAYYVLAREGMRS